MKNLIKILFVKTLVKHSVGNKQEIGIPFSFLALSQYVKEKTFHECAILDYRFQALENGLGVINPEVDFADFDVIAFSCVSSDFWETLRLSRVAKYLGKVTVFGGIFPTQNSDHALSYGSIDFVIRGEGEQPLVGLLEVLSNFGKNDNELKKIHNLSFRAGDGIVINNPSGPVLKNVPEIDQSTWLSIPLQAYGQYTHAHVMATRGCPCNCSFCSVKSMWNRTYRTREIEKIITELGFLQSLGFKRVHLKDETLTAHPRFAQELFTAIKNANLGLSLKIKSRIDGIKDGAFLELLQGAGVDYIHFGVETMSDMLLQNISKGSSINSHLIRLVLKQTMMTGIKINPIFIVGIPGQTPRDLDMTYDYVQTLGVNPAVVLYLSFWTPHPENGRYNPGHEIILLENDLERYTHKQPVSVPKSMSSYDDRLLMLDFFDAMSVSTGNRSYNPALDPDFREKYLYATEVSNDNIPFI